MHAGHYNFYGFNNNHTIIIETILLYTHSLIYIADESTASPLTKPDNGLDHCRQRAFSTSEKQPAVGANSELQKILEKRRNWENNK